MNIKVISVIQPWATLIALNEKDIETRSWDTSYRGELYIHASKKYDKEICRTEPFKSILKKHGYDETNLPVGEIIAKTNLVDCCEVVNEVDGSYAELERGHIAKDNEYSFGSYEPGRYGWILEETEKITPIKANGKLRIWNYDSNEEKVVGINA